MKSFVSDIDMGHELYDVYFAKCTKKIELSSIRPEETDPTVVHRLTVDCGELLYITY